MSTPSLRALEERLRAGPVAVPDAAATVPPAVLLAWAFDTIERRLGALTAVPLRAAELVDDLHTGLAVGRGWLASPSWRRSVAAREAGARLSPGERSAVELVSGQGDGDPRLDPLARLGAAALEACATIAESRAVREEGLRALSGALQSAEGALLAEPDARERLALHLRGETPKVEPPRRDAWARRLEAALDRPAPDGAGLLLFLRLERLVAAWPALFSPLHHAVSGRLSEGEEGGLLAGILPWAPRRLRGVTAPDEAARLVSDLRLLVQRFARDDLARPMSVQRRPLAGSAVRAVRVVVDDPRDGRLAAPFLAWLEPYAASGAALGHGQTMQFGSFLLRLRVVDGVLAIEAPDLHADPGSVWTPSLSEVLAVTTLQEQVAAAFGVKGEPPRLDATMLVSRGSERTPVELRRVTTDRSGDSGWELRPRAAEEPGPGGAGHAGIAGRIARTAQLVPLSDVVAACPHILPFLTLPSGTSVLWSAHPSELPAVTLRGVAVEDGRNRLERAFKAVVGLRG